MTRARVLRSLLLPALCGFLSGAAGLAIAHLLAQFIEPNASPIIAVGNAAIDATPTPLKEFAIRHFGTNDKTVLVTGILATLALLTMAIGILAQRKFRFGAGAVVVLGIVAIVAELRQQNATTVYAVPTAIGLACAVGLLYLLLRPIHPVGAADTAPVDAVATDSGGASAVTLRSRIFTPASRRQFLLTSAGVTATAALSVGAAKLVSGSKSTAGARNGVSLPAAADPAPALPAVDPPVSGITPFVTTNRNFYRVDTSLVTPQVNPDTWKLKIEGMVKNPYTLSYSDILGMPLTERYITQTCVSNEVGGSYVSTAKFLGVPLKTLMDKAGLDPAAEQLFATSTDGFTTSTPVKVALDGRDAMIVVGMNGEALPLAHGFPARMIVPGLYGYVSGCKWIKSINAATYASKKAYWTQRKWDINGPVLTETRIDVPRSLAQVKAGVVPIAGISWAQTRGISKVEVQIDDGAWSPATLTPVPNNDTWRQWYYKWDAKPGRHTLRARAIDATGAIQTANRQDTFPRGATGIQESIVIVT